MDDISQLSAKMSNLNEANQASASCFFRTAVPTSAANPVLMIAFQTESDRPNTQKEAFVQETTLVSLSDARRLSMLVESSAPEQPRGPSHSANSTPAWKTPRAADTMRIARTRIRNGLWSFRAVLDAAKGRAANSNAQSA
ncbi:hypothetical protein D3C71_1729270 [compost metagenome]